MQSSGRFLGQFSHSIRCGSAIIMRAGSARLSPLTTQTITGCNQRQEMHTLFNRQKIHDFIDNRMIYITEINNTALKYGLFGVAVGNPSTWVVSLITYINSFGLPWWGAIAGVAVGFRLVLLPFSIKASRQAQKMQEIQPELNILIERSRLSQSMGLASDANRIREEMMDVYKRSGVSPMAPMVGSLIQLPVVMSCFLGIRKLCEKSVAVSTGGLWWFTNLSAADPYFILPALAGLSTLFMTELGADGMNANGQVGTKYMMRGMSLFTVFIAAKMPSGLCLYWIVNSVFAGIQTICINPSARATLKRWVTFSKKVETIPPPPKELPVVLKKKDVMKQNDYNKLMDDVKESVFKDNSKK